MAAEAGTWPAASILADNRQRLRKELEKRLRVFEGRYELKSERLEDALKDGRLAETSEVCSWLIVYRTLRSLRRDQ